MGESVISGNVSDNYDVVRAAGERLGVFQLPQKSVTPRNHIITGPNE
jgi:hypothetical protein